MERLTIVEQLENLMELFADAERAIERAASQKRVDLVLRIFYENPSRINIVTDQYGYHVPFVKIIKGSVQAPEIDQSGFPWKIPLDGHKIDLELLGRHLHQFISSTYPEVERLPVYIHGSRQDFLEKKPPMAIINPAGKVFTQ